MPMRLGVTGEERVMLKLPFGTQNSGLLDDRRLTTQQADRNVIDAPDLLFHPMEVD